MKRCHNIGSLRLRRIVRFFVVVAHADMSPEPHIVKLIQQTQNEFAGADPKVRENTEIPKINLQ